MDDTMGIILTGSDSGLSELTRVRSVAALPVAGRYRLIDFILSGMVNSGITNVGVTAQTNYRSLMDHLGSGKEWDLNRKLYGLRILPPYIKGYNDGYWGDIDILAGIKDFLSHSGQKYVLLAHGDLLFNPRFDEIKETHCRNNADITMLCGSCGDAALTLKGSGRVSDIARSTEGACRSMGIYFMEKELLERQIARCISRGLHDFLMDVLVHNVDNLRIFACPYSGSAWKIDSVAEYYRCNMDMLHSGYRKEIFMDSNFIYTKVKDTVPTVYGEDAKVSGCLIADGCRIEGRVENSILFRGVSVEAGATVRNSIIMQNASIRKNASLEYAVLDKSVVMREGKHICGQDSFPVIIGKGITV